MSSNLVFDMPDHTQWAYLAVFDLDGTIADDSHRSPLVQKPNRDFYRYYALAHKDKLVWQLKYLAVALASSSRQNRIEIWTGRPEGYRQATEKWLKHVGMPYHRLRMRKDGDNRVVTEVKAEWLEYRRPDIIFDDRTFAVEFWRSLGILCCQVQQNDY